jgi:hypothetical protein
MLKNALIVIQSCSCLFIYNVKYIKNLINLDLLLFYFYLCIEKFCQTFFKRIFKYNIDYYIISNLKLRILNKFN